MTEINKTDARADLLALINRTLEGFTNRELRKAAILIGADLNSLQSASTLNKEAA